MVAKVPRDGGLRSPTNLQLRCGALRREIGKRHFWQTPMAGGPLGGPDGVLPPSCQSAQRGHGSICSEDTGIRSIGPAVQIRNVGRARPGSGHVAKTPIRSTTVTTPLDGLDRPESLNPAARQQRLQPTPPDTAETRHCVSFFGWYPDRLEWLDLRYADGKTWTERTGKPPRVPPVGSSQATPAGHPAAIRSQVRWTYQQMPAQKTPYQPIPQHSPFAAAAPQRGPDGRAAVTPGRSSALTGSLRRACRELGCGHRRSGSLAAVGTSTHDSPEAFAVRSWAGRHGRPSRWPCTRAGTRARPCRAHQQITDVQPGSAASAAPEAACRCSRPRNPWQRPRTPHPPAPNHLPATFADTPASPTHGTTASENPGS